MTAYYFQNIAALMGCGPCHLWSRWLFKDESSRWTVTSSSPFCRDGVACIDDFGNLCEVAS